MDEGGWHTKRKAYNVQRKAVDDHECVFYIINIYTNIIKGSGTTEPILTFLLPIECHVSVECHDMTLNTNVS